MALTEQEQQGRRIGGSVIPKIVGVSRFGTALDAYRELTGEIRLDIESEDLDRGTFLEPALSRWAEKKLGDKFVKPSGTLVHPTLPFATYSPDGLAVEDQDLLLEIKSPGRFADGWGEEGTDQVPDDYAVQVQWGMFVTGRKVAAVCALIDGRLKVYRLVADVELHGILAEKAQAFIEKHVDPRVPPPLTFGDHAYIKAKYPTNHRPPLVFDLLTPAQKDLVTDYVSQHRVAASESDALEALEVAMKEMIADHAGIEFSEPVLLPGRVERVKRIDWKQNAPSKKTDWPSVAEYLRASVGEKEWTEAVDNFTTEKPGARPFVPRFEKVKK